MGITKKLISITSKKQLFVFTILFLCGFFEVSLSETYANKSILIKKIIDCSNNPILKKCHNIISYTETIQLREYDKGNYRCQTSLLGAQTELIKTIYFDKRINDSRKISIPFVIKNCKL